VVAEVKESEMNAFEKAARRVRAAYGQGCLWVRAEHAYEVLDECETLVAKLARDRDVEVARLERQLGEATAELRRIEAEGDQVRTELWALQAGAVQLKEAADRLTAGLVQEPAALPRPRPVRAIR
jgi:hypothetical protein